MKNKANWDNRKIVKLYADIAELTLTECKKSCKVMGSCCEEYMCQVAIAYAKDSFGISLTPTGNLFSMMDNEGKCIAPPHTRPLCSLHACPISSFGAYKDLNLTEEYFSLRCEIDEEEYLRHVNNEDVN